VEHVEWLGRQLEGRQTMLIFDDYQSELFDIEDGLDQGNVQSLITYHIQLTNFVNLPEVGNGDRDSIC
jgi:hypothetical protein